MPPTYADFPDSSDYAAQKAKIAREALESLARGAGPDGVERDRRKARAALATHFYQDGSPRCFVPCRACQSSDEGCSKCEQYKCYMCHRWRPWSYGGHPGNECDSCWVDPEAPVQPTAG